MFDPTYWRLETHGEPSGSACPATGQSGTSVGVPVSARKISVEASVSGSGGGARPLGGVSVNRSVSGFAAVPDGALMSAWTFPNR